MFSKPNVMDNFKSSHTCFHLDFKFKNNITFLTGDSGIGKTVIFSILQEAAVENDKLLCINYLDINKDVLSILRCAENKLVVIDNADILLTSEIRKWISFDRVNQYLIIGRNSENLLITEDNFYELNSNKQGEVIEFTLKPIFDS